MPIQIKHWITGAILWEGDAGTMKEAVEAALAAGANLDGANLDGANLTRANLTRANLYGANLYGANLTRANLTGANLAWANLTGANLTWANLDGANLTGANLAWANLYGANLTRANLDGANLYGANLDGANLDGANLDGATRLPTGETWQEYVEQVVPALLTAGGKSLEECKEHWECHTWSNCPMAWAFNCSGLEGVPILFRPRAAQFIQFFDAKLLPCPCAEPVAP